MNHHMAIERIAASSAGRQPLEPCRDHLWLSERARQRAGDVHSLGALFAGLVAERLHPDALQVIPFLLDRRAALWWGCLCVWQAVRRAPSGSAHDAIEAVVRSVIEPTEMHRRAAEAAAERAGWNAAGCLAMAAFWLEGSMAPAGLPEVLVPPHIALQLLGRTALLAAAEGEPLALARRHEQFLTLGLEVFEGWHSWIAPEPAAAADELVAQFETVPVAVMGAAQ